MRKTILFIAMSLDGFIADEDGGIDFLSAVESPGEDYGYSQFISHVDTVIMGRKTYDKVLSFGIDFPHAGKKCYVWSQSRIGKDKNVDYVQGDLTGLLSSIRSTPGKDIFIDGGATLVHALMEKNLIDQYIISVIPVMLGSGIPLFRSGRPAEKLHLIQSLSYPKGLVQLWYDNIP